MIEETIRQLEEQLQATPNLTPERRREAQELIAQLRRELAAARASGCEFPSTTETELESANDSLVDKLAESVTEFETTHPQLVGTVNRISTILANMGI